MDGWERGVCVCVCVGGWVGRWLDEGVCVQVLVGGCMYVLQCLYPSLH